MESRNKGRTAQILKIMRILAWVAFVGLAVEAGAVLVSYGISLINPEGAKNLYRGLDLYEISQFSFRNYTIIVSFYVAIMALKSYVALLVAQALSYAHLKNPFRMQVVHLLERISFVLLGIWFIALLNNSHIRWVLHRTGEMAGTWASDESIFMAGLVFVLTQVFKRGVEIQTENELTV